MSKVLITTSSFNVGSAESLAALKRAGIDIVINPHGRRLTEDEVAAMLDDKVIGMIAGTEPLTRRVLASAKGLKVVSRCGIGLDSVDLDAAKEMGIGVYNTPDAPSVAAAELTVGLMLAVLRKIPQADRQIRDGKWKPMMGGLLSTRTVGVVGYGRIGRRVARLVRAFGVRVLASDVVEGESDGVAERCSLERLLAEADVVTLHLPSLRDSILNEQRIRSMKPGAIVINTARGGLLDEDALVAALREGRLAGAALDTFEHEPYSGPLVELPQVVLTAHMGSYAEEARGIMEREAADNLLKGLTDRGFIRGHVEAER